MPEYITPKLTELKSLIRSGQAPLADFYLRNLSAQANEAAALGDIKEANSLREEYHKLCRTCDGLARAQQERD